MNIPGCSNTKFTCIIVCPVIVLLLFIRYRGIFNLPENVQDIIYYSEVRHAKRSLLSTTHFIDTHHLSWGKYSRSEWPNSYVSFRRYNILFEYVMSLVYKLISFVYPANKFNVYAYAVLLIHSMGISALFLISSILGDWMSGVCSVLLYMSLFQEKLVSRISALPLRENISLPLFWMSIPPLLRLILCGDVNSDKGGDRFHRLLYGICIATSLLTWQFSPFLVSTQLLVIIVLNYLQIISSSTCDAIVKTCAISFFISTFISLFSPLMIGSLLVKVIITYYLSDIIYYRISNIQCKINILNNYPSVKQFVLKSVIFSVLIIFINICFSIYFTDDSHVFDIMFVKLGLKTPNFDTLIYEMGVEFRFFPAFMFKLILNTNLPLLLLLSLVIILISCKGPIHYYIILQTFGFTFLMLLVARLRVLALPLLCVLASLSACSGFWLETPLKKYISSIYKRVIRWIVPFLVLSIAAKPVYNVGIFNEIGLYKYGENYYNEQADELVHWVNAISNDGFKDISPVVFSDMPTSSIIRSATHASLVVNPHYENKPIKERIRMYYSLASCIDDPKWLFDRFKGFGVNYLIVQMKMLYVKGEGIESLVNSLEYEKSSCKPGEVLEKRLVYKIMTDDEFFKLVFVNGNYMVFTLDGVEGLSKLELNLPKGDIITLYLPTHDGILMERFHDIALEEFSDILGDVGYSKASDEIDVFLREYFNRK